MATGVDPLGYFLGQCTAFVADSLSWVRGGWGNAIDWLGNAQAQGFQTSNVPVPGAIAVYGTAYSPYGHVAIVLPNEANQPAGTFQVREQNYQGPGIVDTRTSSSAGVLGFILPPGNAMSSPAGQSVTLDSSSSGAPPIPQWLWDILSTGNFSGTNRNMFGQNTNGQGLFGPVPDPFPAPSTPSKPPSSVGQFIDTTPIGVGLGVLGAGINSIPTAIGHGLANAAGASVQDVKVWFSRNIISLSVALVVVYVLFEGDIGGSGAGSAMKETPPVAV